MPKSQKFLPVFVAALSFAVLPLYAQTPAAPAAPVPAPAPAMTPPAPTPPAAAKPDDAKAAPAAIEAPKASDKIDEKRMSKMRDRWRKLSPDQREEMRKKAERRLQERYDRLKADEQGQITGIMGEIDKLNKEQRSILIAKIRQKSFKETQQRKFMRELETMNKAPAAGAPASGAAPAAETPAAPAAEPPPQ